MSQEQPQIGSRLSRVIEQDGLQFRDLDGDGVLAPYEDWRLTPAERAADLVKRMNVEEKAGLMIIGSHYPGYSPLAPESEGKDAEKCEPLLNPVDMWREDNPITGVPFTEPVLATSSTENAINLRNQRYLIVRDNLPLTVPASMQAIADSPRDIPGKFLDESYTYVDSAGMAYKYGHGLNF